VIGRIVIDDPRPRTPGGHPAKAVIGETVRISADIYRDGHDILGAAVRLRGPGSATVTEPSVSARTEVISPAGSACAMEPTVVPRLRIAGWATFAPARASSGWTRAAASSFRS
jgi:starch synthase (maltosyl-transferring)